MSDVINLHFTLMKGAYWTQIFKSLSFQHADIQHTHRDI